MKPWIVTASGAEFSFLNPDPDTILIEDIAHALGHICRYTGNCRQYYSVAEHCVWASHVAPEGYKLEALLHDGSEAYIGDVSSPLKRLLPDYQAIEEIVESAVASKFGLRYPWPDAVKAADLAMLKVERDHLIPLGGTPWGILDGVEPAPVTLACYSPEQAKEVFLLRFQQLWVERQLLLAYPA